MTAPDVLDIVVVEDDPRYRDSLATLLRHAPGFRLVGVYDSAVAAVEELSTGDPKPHLVLMDLDLPGMRGSEATRRLKSRSPELLIVVLTVFEEPSPILEAVCAGADGYLLKRTPPAELLEQLRIVAGGGSPLTAGVARTVLDLLRGNESAHNDADSTGLSEREREVLRGLVDGLAYKQVADRLGISIDTVRTHVRGLYKKLQVHSVAEAVTRALREKLI
ncbi:MAG: response regulator transcription factor [Candidatus Eisenbacteria bacterium]